MKPTTPLYEQQPFARQFTGRIAAVDPARPNAPRVALDETLFYPEGGGQPCDDGLLWLEGCTDPFAVVDVHRQGAAIWHTLSTLGASRPLTELLREGGAVRGEINWHRRFDHMQQHTGEHILSGTLHRLFGTENVGFHIGAEVIRMDLDKPLEWEDLKIAELRANEVVWANVLVQATVYPGEAAVDKPYRSKKELDGPVRIVEIPGGDCCACCGTHLERSGQVGMIKILTAEHYKGGTRLTAACGGRALAAAEAMRSRQQRIGALLSAQPEATFTAVQRLYEEKTAVDYRYYGLCQQLSELLAAQAAQTPEQPVLVSLPRLEPAWLARMATRLAAAVPGTVCAVISEHTQATFYCLASGTQDVRPLTKQLNAALGGKGGGKPNSCQGSCPAVGAARVEATLRTLLAEGQVG